MSAQTNVVAYDGASTPIQHTLIPLGVTRQGNKIVGQWRENAAGIPVYAQVRLQITLERQRNGVYKGNVRTSIPVQEVVTGSNSAGYSAAPKVAHELTEDSVIFVHERSDASQRRTLRQLHNNIMNGVTTSVAPASAGPVYELIDLLLLG